MAARLRGLLDRLLARRRAAAHDGVSDAELLLRFTRDRDEAAFELLVWRHGAMVLGLCRRAVRDEQLAEDAFQAVFLVLARKAGSVRGNLGGWLFQVARRVALRALQKQPVVQPVVETPAEPVPCPAERDELSALLDAEIARLPERLRRPVVLCYLGDRSTEDAARELGCPRGTVLSRLATARKRLAERLTRRGVTLPAALATTALSARLVSSATAAATAFRCGTLTLSTATQLADGVIQTMNRATLLTVTGSVVLAAAMAGGIGWVAANQGPKAAVAAADPAPAQPKTAPDAPKPAQPDPTAAKREADEKLKKLDHLADTLRIEIEAMEKQIALLAQAGGGAVEGRLAVLQKRFADTDEEYRRSGHELLKLEAEAVVVKKLIDGKGAHLPLDTVQIERTVSREETVLVLRGQLTLVREALERAVQLTPGAEQEIKDRKANVATAEKKLEAERKRVTDEVIAGIRAVETNTNRQRLAKLEIDIEIKKTVREALKTERDLLSKTVDTNANSTAAVATLQKLLESQREMLARVQREMLLLRARQNGITFTEAPTADAKFDAILKELVELRREVQELKAQLKREK